MLGIDQSRQPKRKMCIGPETATISCVLQKATAIRSQRAYLGRLTQIARQEVFSLQPMLMALANREIVS
jgi:replication initiation protein RepC